MKYELFDATDTRDGRRLLWLVDAENQRVATFCHKWAPSRIKHRTAASPDSIIWEPASVYLYAGKDDRLIDSWEF